MANTKNTMTQAAAIRYLIDHAGPETPADVIAAAEKLYTAKTKKYERPAGVKSKERLANESIVPEFVDLIASNPDEMVNATWLNAHCANPAVRSPQKARVIADIAIEMGLVEKYQDRGRTYYRLVK